MTEIHLYLKKEHNALLLNNQDICKFINENDENDVKLAAYISKLCDYLNCKITGNANTSFNDIDHAKLSGWLTGYETAMGYEVLCETDTITVRTENHVIVLDKPKKDIHWSDLYPSCPHFAEKHTHPDPIGHDTNSDSFCMHYNTFIIPFIHCKKCSILQNMQTQNSI